VENIVRESERLLQEARRLFAEAAKCDDPVEMHRLAKRAAECLARAQDAAEQEKKKENGGAGH